MTDSTRTTVRAVQLTVALVAALVAVLVATAAPAFADGREAVKNRSWSTGPAFCVANGSTLDHSAVGCFNPNSDDIQPGDLKKDGRRVGVQWRTDYGRSGFCVDAEGKDATFSPESGTIPARGEHSCPHEFLEGHTITFRVGTCDGSATNCKPLRNWGEWTPWISRETDE